MKYWRVRLVLMPVSKDYTVKNIESGQTKPDTRQEMSHEDFFHYVEQFIRFLMMLNKLVRVRGTNDYLHRVKTKHRNHIFLINSCSTFFLSSLLIQTLA